MKHREFEAMGTTWWIEVDRPDLLDGAEALVHRAEARLSRFEPTSALSRLNRQRDIIDPMLAEVVRAATQMRTLTQGVFDPGLGARMCEIGYDRTFEAVDTPRVDPSAAPRTPLRVRLEGDRVRLRGDGAIDLGGIAKGWTVDLALGWLLEAGASEVLVDGGGDIAAAGSACLVGVADSLVVDASTCAVATSSTRRRRWHSATGAELHHVVDPRTGWPARTAIDTVTVVAPTAARADALATAVLVDPDRLLPKLPSMAARAAVRSHDGAWWTTPNWERD